jgi:hypothetical protein
MITRLPLAALITASLFWGTAVSVTKYDLARPRRPVADGPTGTCSCTDIADREWSR